jgi:signal peptidase II
MNYRIVFFWFALCSAAVLDRMSKVWALTACQEPRDITPWLRCDLVINRGISFGLFDGHDKVLFGVVTFLVLVVMSFVALRAYHRLRAGCAIPGELCILVGAVSNNVFDRFYYGGVIDYIVVWCRYATWPAFNIADVLIVGGALYLIWTSSRETKTPCA